MLEEIVNAHSNTRQSFEVGWILSGNRGRPRLGITRGQLEVLMERGFRIRDVAIFGGPGADRGGKGKSKRAKENSDKEKHSRARKAPGDMFLPHQFQTVSILIGARKFSLPNQRSAGREIVSCLLTRKSLDRRTRLVRSARLLEEKSLNHSSKCTGNRSEYRRRNTVDLSQVSLQ